MINKKRWLNELHRRCVIISKSNRNVDHECMEERDRLIQFANRAVELQAVTKPQVRTLINMVDQQLFGA